MRAGNENVTHMRTYMCICMRVCVRVQWHMKFNRR